MPTQKDTSVNHKELINNLVGLLEKGNAHVSLDEALNNIPFALLGEKPSNLPYSIWQVAEHIRITQWDLLEFSRDAAHVSPQWPDEYWPVKQAPESQAAWQKCIDSIHAERKAFVEMLKDPGADLFKVFEHGNGQTLLKETLVLADHNSYHTGELIIIRRLLNAWKSK